MPEEMWKISAGHFKLGTTEELHACVHTEDGYPCIELQVHRLVADGQTVPTDEGLWIPASLLPELKRMVQRLEESLVAQGLSDEFQDPEQLRAERKHVFAHPSEKEFAGLLDFYEIRWEYEPKTFPIQWDEHGKILESFTPDFYLLDQDLYIELTTRKQSLVTKKNRKVRLLKQLYPEVNIKIFYGRDFKQLVQKYGIEEKNNSGNHSSS